jgi:crotonobetaine/carnitine-CoA ligase
MDELAWGKSPLSEAAERVRAIEASALPENLGALLDAAAREAGDRIVWDFFEEGQQETYESLRRRVNGIAAKLLELGLRKGTHLAVMLPNIPAFPLLWLALARIGAVMVPVNIAYRARELTYVLNDSEAEYLVVDSALSPVIAACRASGEVSLPVARQIVVGGEAEPGAVAWRELDCDPRDSFEAPEPVGADDLLNIQYTSGTTGFPKGCMLTQRYWLIAGKVNAFRDGSRYGRILAPMPFFYMDPQWLLSMCLYGRGTLFVGRRQSTTRFMDWVRDFRIEFCLLPWIILKQPPSERDGQNAVERANVYGLPPEIHAEIERRFNLRAREAYGMTEIGPAAFMPIEAAAMVGSGFAACRRRFANAAWRMSKAAPCRRARRASCWCAGPGS